MSEIVMSIGVNTEGAVNPLYLTATYQFIQHWSIKIKEL